MTLICYILRRKNSLVVASTVVIVSDGSSHLFVDTHFLNRINALSCAFAYESGCPFCADFCFCLFLVLHWKQQSLSKVFAGFRRQRDKQK